MLKGRARLYLDTEIECLQRNLSYEFFWDLLTWIYHEFDVCEELSPLVQLEGEGVAAFTSAVKHLAAKVFPKCEEIRLRTEGAATEGTDAYIPADRI